MTSPEEEGRITEIKTLTVKGAALLQEQGLLVAEQLEVKNGFLAVFNVNGTILTATAIGDVLQLHQETALGKGKSVIATHRSTSVQKERMQSTHATRDDYADTLGSLFKGGVAIFEDQEHQIFIGAMAFGGSPDENIDEQVCLQAVVSQRYYTDAV